MGSAANRKLTLEPRMLYLYAPYRNQNDLPVFDTALPDLVPVELFRNNRYVGADRVSDADQVAMGVTSRLLDGHDGRQFLAVTIGQIYYFETPRVVLAVRSAADRRALRLRHPARDQRLQELELEPRAAVESAGVAVRARRREHPVQARRRQGHQRRVPLRARHHPPRQPVQYRSMPMPPGRQPRR